MRPHPRIRKSIKWGGLVLACLLAAAWWFSAYRQSGWQSSRGPFVYMGSGCIGAGTAGSDPWLIAGWYSQPYKQPQFPQMKWWFDYRTIATGYRDFAIPIWLIALTAYAASACAWWRDATAKRTKFACSNCSYDRTGLPTSAPCPECGQLS